MPSSRVLRAIRVAACLLLSFIVLSYMWLIPLGRWQLDEYVEFYHMRNLSAPLYLIERLTWSPRPISELLYCSYGWAVNHFHQQFIVPLLGSLWVILLVAGLLTFWSRRQIANLEDSWSSLLIALTLIALCLTGGNITEVFYWPAGAVAYVPTLAATLLLFLQVVEGQLDVPRGRLIAGICLIVAAGSSEVGAMFVLCYASIQFLQWLREALSSRDRSDSRPLLWYLVPMLLAAMVLLFVRMNRFRVPEVAEVSAIAGHSKASLIASVKETAFEVIGRKMLAETFHANPHPSQWLHSGLRLPLEMLAGSRLTMEILLPVGVALCWALRRPSRRLLLQILELLAALLLVSFLSIAVAEMHFGHVCCERHESLRESWTAMILTGAAIVFVGLIREERRQWLVRRRSWAPLLLVLAVVSLGCFGPLFHTYQRYSWLREIRKQNFESGFRKGEKQMSFTVLPYEGIIIEEPIPTGTYARPPVITGFSYDVYPYYLLGFFDKQRVSIRSLTDKPE